MALTRFSSNQLDKSDNTFHELLDLNVSSIIEVLVGVRFQLTYWVARSIVETPSLEERVSMFSRVLEVMMVFEELNNFTGLVALYSALNSSSVYRLKACWEVCEVLSKNFVEIYISRS